MNQPTHRTLAYSALLVLLHLAAETGATPATLDDAARSYLAARDVEELPLLQASGLTQWTYAANLTDYNRDQKDKISLELGKLALKMWKDFKASGWQDRMSSVQDEGLRRQLELIAESGGLNTSAEDLAESNRLVGDMASVYSKANICLTLKGSKVCNLNLEPELTNLLSENRNYEELKNAWVGWRDVSGKQVRAQYKRYIELVQKIALDNNISDIVENRLSPYESDDFRGLLDGLMKEIKPLYQQLHAYVRRKLRKVYGEDHVSMKGPIPAHLFGNMWAQSWDNIEDITTPFPQKQAIDVSDAMKEQGYTPLKMFELSDKFFRDLNLTGMSKEFYERSIMTKPPNVDMICHASAWDLNNGNDFRIKMCTDVTMEKLQTIHHEMGHVEYYIQYKDQPIAFRNGANPGFHEAVGDALALSVTTPKHLYRIGLLKSLVEDKETDLNFLMNKALGKIAFLPFGYLIDSYRWDVFDGTISKDNLNCEWWNKRFEFQGIKPPVERSEIYFDPGAKYHVVSDVPYIRYFVSFIVQFQFHKAMCLKAGQYDPTDPAKPLYKCDINESPEAGNALASMLKLGSSRPWSEALKTLTGSSTMDVGVLKEYFQPLEEWLVKDNQDHGEYIGWERDGTYCAA